MMLGGFFEGRRVLGCGIGRLGRGCTYLQIADLQGWETRLPLAINSSQTLCLLDQNVGSLIDFFGGSEATQTNPNRLVGLQRR